MSQALWGRASNRRRERGGRIRAVLGCAALSALGVGLVAQAAGPAPTFADAVTLPSGGSNPRSVRVADVNGDGKLDLIAANSSSNDLGVLLSDGAGGFADAVTFPSGGSTPRSVAVADVNGDGKPDLIAANQTSHDVGVLVGDGAGGFADAVMFPSGGFNTIWVTVADVSGDGKPDLIVANSSVSGNLGVLVGDGAGGFADVVTLPSGGSNPRSVAVADVNGDGKPDLITGNGYSNNLGVLLGNGAGGFASAVTFPSGGNRPLSVAVADVNGDGKPDLIAGNYSIINNYTNGTLGVLIGNGSGGFAASATFQSGGTQLRALQVADVNGDGKPDLIAANQGSHTLGVLVGDGSGGFADVVTFPSGGYFPHSIAVADVNGDGKSDLVAASLTGHTLGVLLNTTVAPDTTPPTGTPLAVGTSGASNGQAYVPVRLQDAGSGVKQVQLTSNSYNVHFEYPLGVVKANPLVLPSPLADVTVYAVKDSNAKTRVELKVTDAAGNLGLVDPIIANLEIKKGKQLSRTFNKIPQAERYVRLQNGTPGFTSAKLWINGKIASNGNLTDGQVVDLDVAEWLKPGSRNTAKILAAGPRGATAILTVGDVATGTDAASLRARSGGKVNLEFSR